MPQTTTKITKDRLSHVQETPFDRERFKTFFEEIVADSGHQYSAEDLDDIFKTVVEDVESRDSVAADRLFDMIIRVVNDHITPATPHFTYLSAAALRRKLYKQASRVRGFDYKRKYGDYYSFVVQMVEQGIYDSALLKAYTREELEEAGTLVQPELDKKFSYAGIYMLYATYLKRGYNKETLELPQERFLTSALYLMKDETRANRMEYVREAYWVLSNHYVGLATPTLLSSGAPHGTLSSCHIITVGDDLVNIFDALTQTARFSQNGAGLGIFLGFLRASGSWIRGYKGRASGILHPARLFSVLAEYVNQLGSRVAGIALYLPAWHADIFDFLDLRLKTGSQETRAHSIKTAVTLPDEFMRRLESKSTFTLFDPYELKKKLDIDLNNLYDAKRLMAGEEPNPEDHAFTYWYRQAEQSTELELSRTVNATDVYRAIFQSRKTSGTPYLYYHDTSARLNPNHHEGMPYGSNLCCVTADQLVVTDQGMKRVGDLYLTKNPLTLFDGNERVTADPMQLVEKDAQIYKIITEDGFEHRVTSYHKVKTSRGMIEAKDLWAGDMLYVQNNRGLFGDEHDRELAFLFGWYQADGTDAENSVFINTYEHKNPEMSGVIKAYVDQAYEEHGWTNTTQLRKRHVADINTPPSVMWQIESRELREYGFGKGYVPKFVWNADEFTQGQYLAGLFFPNAVVRGVTSERRDNPTSIVLSDASRTFLQEIKLLLANCGIHSKVTTSGNLSFITISGRHDIARFDLITSLLVGRRIKVTKPTTPAPQRLSRIVAVVEDGVEDVYCTTVHTDEHVWVCNGVITSNSEIIQNMEQSRQISEILTEDGTIITLNRGDGLVSCNLNSLVLNNVFQSDTETKVDLQRVVDIQFRMLDNVISLNRTVVPQATHTNNLYRAVGAGAMGLVALLTSNQIRWESNDAINFTGNVFKQYLQAAIRASHKLAMEKGSYELFEGSGWQTGAFFDKRGFVSDEWLELRRMAAEGMRNGYLMAIAPTSSNSLVMNSSPSIDPPYAVVYKEDKSGLSVLVVPPNYNDETKWFYRSGFEMDEMWAINIIAAAQKYIDQGVSHNYHISKEIKGSELLRLDMGAWKKGVKTVYYTYTEDFELADDCIMCQS